MEEERKQFFQVCVNALMFYFTHTRPPQGFLKTGMILRVSVYPAEVSLSETL